MQIYKFIFLARSWASDRVELSSRLSALGQQAQQEDKPLTLLLYPEGTLISQNTRPISKKFADRMGIVCSALIHALDFISDSPKADMTNTLLPRSTGLHYSLRSFAPRVPALQLIDITVVYPGEFHGGV
jgi:1-acyl-sn-glycerol-3-phosphate acyltransferase